MVKINKVFEANDINLFALCIFNPYPCILEKSNFGNVWERHSDYWVYNELSLKIFDTTVASHFAFLAKNDQNSDNGQDKSYSFESPGAMKK